MLGRKERFEFCAWSRQN